jgi:Cu-Zn family superoxide dismutase
MYSPRTWFAATAIGVAVIASAQDTDAARGATVSLSSTQGHATVGRLMLEQAHGGVRFRGEVTGLTPNAEHAFHVHETGDCSAPDASSAGEHFNPEHQPHGHPEKGAHHAGDMLNLRADARGRALVDILAGSLTIGGDDKTNVVGKALIVHADPDDFVSQPGGGSGDRLACGLIEPRLL